MIVTFDNKKDAYAFKLYYSSKHFRGVRIVEIPAKADSFDVEFDTQENYEAFKAQALQYFDIDELLVDETGGGKNNRFDKLLAKDFMTLSAGATISDGSNGDIVSSINFANWRGSSCPTQLQNAIVLKDNLTRYQGIILKVRDNYTLTCGIESGGKFFAYGIGQMSSAVASCNRRNNTFGLSTNPSAGYNLNANDLVFVRFSNPTGGYFQFDVIRNNASYKTYQYDAPAGYQVYLGISQGWMGGGSNIVAQKVVGVKSGDKLCKKPLSADECKTITDEYNKVWG